MRTRRFLVPVALLVPAFLACATHEEVRPSAPVENDLSALLARWPADPSLVLPGEDHLADLRQLTFGGENAEAYWSPDGLSIIFQSTPRERMGTGCDQEYVLDLRTGQKRLVSTGKGKTTCGYFIPGTDRILFSSTHLASTDCPPRPDRSHGYVWKLEDGFDIFTADLDGSNLVRLTDTPGYDAEATLREDGGRIVFTSLRSGDLDLWTMRPDGSDLRRLTRTLGYEGGAFYSPDGKRIVFRAHEPRTEKEVREYRSLIDQRLVRPLRLELFVMNADGGDVRQVTHNGAANFAPYWFRDGRRIIFASNVADPAGRDFDLWSVRDDGTGMERITRNPTFDGFPMFSPDGRFLLFCSNRGNEQPHETNVFIARWQD